MDAFTLQWQKWVAETETKPTRLKYLLSGPLTGQVCQPLVHELSSCVSGGNDPFPGSRWSDNPGMILAPFPPSKSDWLKCLAHDPNQDNKSLSWFVCCYWEWSKEENKLKNQAIQKKQKETGRQRGHKCMPMTTFVPLGPPMPEAIIPGLFPQWDSMKNCHIGVQDVNAQLQGVAGPMYLPYLLY